MASVTSTTSPEAPFLRTARFLGALNVIISLALAVLFASGLSEIARGSITTGLIMLMVVITLRWLVSLALAEWNHATARSIRRRWRDRTIEHLLLPRQEGERSRGDLALAIEHAADGPSLALLATSARFSVLGLAVVFWSAGWLCTAITIGLMALAVPLYQRAGKRSAALATEYQQRRSRLETRQLELLSHAPELRALGAVAYGADEIAAISRSENVIAMRAIRVALESSLVTEFLSGVSIGLVAMVVGFALLGGRIGLDHALVAVLVTSEIFISIRRFGSEFHRRENATASLARLSTYATPSPASLGGPLLRAANLVTEVNSQPVTVDVAPGDRVLVTGPSGSGKTTLLQTLVGWRVPRAGLAEHSSAVIGYVSAESALLSGSLWQNVTLNAPLARAGVTALLVDLGLVGPRFSDLDAPLLADGRGLSGGERVRIVLARCLLAEADVLVLDDIAGVLDLTTRDRVRAVLEHVGDIAIVEATVDSPLLTDPHTLVRLPDER